MKVLNERLALARRVKGKGSNTPVKCTTIFALYLRAITH